LRFDRYGGVDVLDVREVPIPEPAEGRAVVRVVAAGVNPGEIPIREGRFHDRWPATFPSGQGTDLAGVVSAVGPGVENVAIGDAVIGYSNERSAQADYVSLPADRLVPKPESIPWEVAAALPIAGFTATSLVQVTRPSPGETVVVSGAAGGVGGITTQLALNAGARVIGVAGPANADWLRSLGAEPVEHGDGLEERVRALAPDGVAALLDTFGGGYVALGMRLGVPRERIATIIDWAAAGQYGTATAGQASVESPEVLARIAELVANGELVIPIAATFPLERVRDAYELLAERHTRGKIVLLVNPEP